MSPLQDRTINHYSTVIYGISSKIDLPRTTAARDLISLPGMNASLEATRITENVTNKNQQVRQQRIGARRPARVAARLTWRDGRGALRFVSVTTRNVSDLDAFVECERPASIPLYRLVHLQVESSAAGRADLPAALQRGNVLSAVYRVGPYRPATGTPQGYALRLLVEPARSAALSDPMPDTLVSRPA
jgi:hypothetical protein